jgi:TolA-binding protein
MIRRMVVSTLLVLVLLLVSVGSASAQEAPMISLPPGIAAQAQPLLEAMMAHMQQMGMSPEQMEMMMADIQAMAGQLPPGIFLKLLKLMQQLDMEEMMTLHQQIHQTDLLQQPPGQILVFVLELVR